MDSSGISPENQDSDPRADYLTRSLLEQAIADENYNLATTYGARMTTDWSETTLYSHGVPVTEVQQIWDEALEMYNRALEENAKAETIEILDKRLAKLIFDHIEIVFPENDAKL